MARFHVDGKVVQGVDFLKRRHGTWRLDGWPFAILYAIWLFVAVPSLDFTDALIVLGALAVLHILVLLFTAWSVDFRSFVHFSKVFCVGLWCLDEYWYYSLFTLFLLFLFESMMAKSRLKTLTELRHVRVDGQTLMVHRGGKWVKLSGTDLLPGDVVSIGRSSGQSESTTQWKVVLASFVFYLISAFCFHYGDIKFFFGYVSIAGCSSDDRLSIKRDKSHILFGGTKILQHTLDKSFNLKAPDGGCLAVVLWTGFETSQGKLMQKILFSTERVTANSWESGLFILFLVFFAIIAAGYVLKKGLEDPTRSKYKLFLSCSLIITPVIPPELPMELSIAVNTSLIALACHGIFCTEPFRIPFAGKVDICCFDKTGTLTSDDMEFQGVAGLADNANLESDRNKLPARTVEVLAACHAFVFVDNRLAWLVILLKRLHLKE
ncbi:hypothetical protein COCNU_01G017170 [Cocos nucifera]|uniref:P5A-ATPase transmembrane helical hairpin domain-containing protein n=1 Tax=Cocos nucifera TaxID=13894 RepID=A0A8K0HX43_COCNU|nr:hypothetical protein COCNU_01G017170 [Cocos nucifera]